MRIKLKSGVILTTPNDEIGKGWIKSGATQLDVKTEKSEKSVKSGSTGIKQLKEILDYAGVEYSKRSSKADLEKLVEGLETGDQEEELDEVPEDEEVEE